MPRRPAGVVLEGLQDLLVQYLQLKLDFGVADVVSVARQASRQTPPACFVVAQPIPA